MKPDELALSFDLPKRTVALVLAGGRGSRLMDLTDRRAKPAVYFGGKFRIIDFALSNCLNSGIRRIGVITQYKSHSLLRHLQRGWAFLKSEMNEFVDLLPAQQRTDEESWYRGTADAVYQNQDILASYRSVDYVVVLAGDHIYKMNYAIMLADHVAKGRDCTVGCIAVPRNEASAFGVMAIDDKYMITEFVENLLIHQPCRVDPTCHWPAWASMFSTHVTCTRNWNVIWQTLTRVMILAKTLFRARCVMAALRRTRLS